jgi:P-type conjugative transfer protein TrbJ
MTRLGRRRCLSGALVLGVLGPEVTFTVPARADLWGGDLPLLAAILAQAISMVSQTASMLTQIAYQVKMLQTMIANLDHASFSSILSFINTARYTYNSLTSNVQAMSYSLSRVDSEFKQLFPGDQPPPGTTVAQHRQAYQAWHQEVVGAAQVAARQQTSLETLESHAAKTQDLLSQSESSGGQVAAQLQVIAQLVGITNTELLVLNQTLSTTGRVLTDMAAASASERQLSLAQGDDARANYTGKGAPVAVPHTMP